MQVTAGQTYDSFQLNRRTSPVANGYIQIQAARHGALPNPASGHLPSEVGDGRIRQQFNAITEISFDIAIN